MSKRTIILRPRSANMTNVNFQPEKYGKGELVERCDVSLQFLVGEDEVDQLLATVDNPLRVLWNGKKAPQLKELERLALRIKGEGTCQLGATSDALDSYGDAVLKKVVIEPLEDCELDVRCQVRVDPVDHCETLVALRTRERCVFGFDGADTGEAEKSQGKLSLVKGQENDT